MNPIVIKEKSVMDQQLDNLDLRRMIVKYRVASPDSTQELDAYNEEKKKLRKYFEKLSCRFCLTIDEMLFEDDYYCITVNFIDDDWKLKRNIISLIRDTGDDQIASKCLEKVLLEWEIINNISSMVKSYCYTDKWYVNVGEIRFIGQGSLLSDCKFYFHGFFDFYMSRSCFENEMDPVLYDHMSRIFN